MVNEHDRVPTSALGMFTVETYNPGELQEREAKLTSLGTLVPFEYVWEHGVRVACELIVAYYNGVEITSIPGKGRLPQWIKGYGICRSPSPSALQSFTGLDRLAYVLRRVGPYVRGKDFKMPVHDERLLIKKAGEELRRDRDQFRAAVLWLCSP